MTEKKANEYFKTKYPNGYIKRPHSTSAENRYWVVFDDTKENVKPYYYSAANYSNLLGILKVKGFEDYR
jgi:hypothetical protein